MDISRTPWPAAAMTSTDQVERLHQTEGDHTGWELLFVEGHGSQAKVKVTHENIELIVSLFERAEFQ